VAVSVFFSTFGLLIGPGIAGRVSVLGTAFALGGNLGGAKLILVAKETGGLVVVDVLDTTPLVSFVVPFVVTLLKGFFNGAEIGRFKGLGEPLVNGCLVTNVDVRGVVLVLGVEADFVATGVFGVVGVFGDDIGVVLVKEVRGVVDVVLVDIGRDAGIVVLEAGFGAGLVTVVVFKVEVVEVFDTVVVRTLVVGLKVDGAVDGLNNGFDVVVDEVVFLRIGADVFEANDFVEVVLVLVVAVLALDTVGSNCLDFLEAKLDPATAAIAAVPTAAATAILAT
jgi:hypothetical protein